MPCRTAIVFLAGLSFAVTSCEQFDITVPLRARVFTATPSVGQAPLEVTFTYQRDAEQESVDAVLEFGDGQLENVVLTESAEIARHTYAEVGDYIATLRVAGSASTSTDTRVQIMVKVLPSDFACKPLDIDCGIVPDGRVGEPYVGFTFALLSAEGAVTWSVPAEQLPPGLALSPDGTISGTPTVEGLFVFIAEATDSCILGPQRDICPTNIEVGPRCLNVDIQPTPTPPEGTVGVTYLFRPAVFGSAGSVSLSVGPDSPQPLPPGLSFNGLEVQGSPTAEGTFTVDILAFDGCKTLPELDVERFTFKINPGGCQKLNVNANIQPAQIALGGSFDFTIPFSGGFAPVTLSISPLGESLPPGCTFDGTKVTGTPTATGVFQVLIEARDSCPGGLQLDAEFFDFVINPP